MIITEEGARAEPPDHQDHTPRSHRASTHSSSFTPNRVFCVSNLIPWTHFSGRPKSFAPVPQKRGPSACTYLKRKTLPKALRTQALTALTISILKIKQPLDSQLLSLHRNPLAIAALQAQQNHPLMAQQASAQLAAAQQSGLVMTPHGLMVLPRGH